MDNIKKLLVGATVPVKEIAEFVAHSELEISTDGDLYVYNRYFGTKLFNGTKLLDRL